MLLSLANCGKLYDQFAGMVALILGIAKLARGV